MLLFPFINFFCTSAESAQKTQHKTYSQFAITTASTAVYLKRTTFFLIYKPVFQIFFDFFEKLRFFNKLFLQKFFVVLFLFCFNFLESLFIIERNKNESRKDSRIESAFLSILFGCDSLLRAKV